MPTPAAVLVAVTAAKLAAIACIAAVSWLFGCSPEDEAEFLQLLFFYFLIFHAFF